MLALSFLEARRSQASLGGLPVGMNVRYVCGYVCACGIRLSRDGGERGVRWGESAPPLRE